LKKLIAAGVIGVIAGVGATLLLADDENASISLQARAMLAMLHKPARGSTATEGAALNAAAAPQERAAIRRLLDLPTRLALESLDVSVADERIGTVAVRWLTPTGVSTDGKDSRIAVYIHGGGYVAG
jgi:acetyl esterase/lipase